MAARTTKRYQSAQQAATARINQIQAALDQMQRLLDQEKSDSGKHNWTDAGSLGYISSSLDETLSFWTSTEK